MVDKLIPPRRDQVITSQGDMTQRFAEYLEGLGNTTNDNTDEIASSTSVELLTLIADINNRLGSGDALTSDSDSFTVDSTELFVDQTEA